MTPRQQRLAIVAEVAAERGVLVADIMSRDASRIPAHARHEAMRRIRAAFGDSYPQIGRFFGRDHSTVVYAIKQGGAQ